jgi:hypothetical protein
MRQLPLLDVPADPVEFHHEDAVMMRAWTMAGRCSGLPECCIAAFVAQMLDRQAPRADPRDVRYLRCGACIDADRVVEVRRCPSSGTCLCADAKDVVGALPRHVRLAHLAVMERMVLRMRSRQSSR